MARVLLENVGKILDGNVVAVDDFSLDVADREFMVIVGPSGCGKTTLLRMIAGLEKATSGKITIGDTVVNDVAPKDRDVTMVFQNYALYPHMTVFQNMAFALKLRRFPRQQISKRVHESARLLGIQHLLKRKPKALSGGQRQRVALGRAIVRDPKVFLFDEPLSNLDAKLRVTTRAELKALHSRLQATSIYVTHDQAEAMTLGDRICVMYDGAAQQVAPPREIYDKPANRFVAGFLGTPSMNFFDGSIETNDSGVYFTTGRCRLKLPLSMKDQLTEYNNRAVVLGVRPEDLVLERYRGRDNNSIIARVLMIEALGGHDEVHMEDASGTHFAATLNPNTAIKTGDTITVFVDTEKIHVFESAPAGASISLRA
jgi:multiple sugar transport system ATP-binding protein